MEDFPRDVKDLIANFSLNDGKKSLVQVNRDWRAVIESNHLAIYCRENVHPSPPGQPNRGAIQILSRFDNATSLSLLDAQLFWDPDLGDLLGGLPHLQNLHLENSSRLTVLPWQISQSHMQSILVKACQQLVSLSALGLGSVKHSLRSLSIHNCSGFRTLTAWIGALDELRDLSIVRCSRFANSEASCSLSSLQQLTRLELVRCEQLRNYPSGLGNLLGLQELVIRDNPNLRQALPESITALLGLKLLDIGKSWFRSDDAFYDLPSLTSLVYNSDHGGNRPPLGISALASLQRLHLERCTTPAVPEVFSDLTLLSEVIISGMRFNVNSPPPGLDNLPALRKLKLEASVILSVAPPCIYGLPLVELELLKCSPLSALSENLSSIGTLQRLALVGCRNFLTLPESIRALTSLSSLTVSECPIVSCPDGMTSLVLLEQVNFSGCDRLFDLPEGLGALNLLTNLDLNGCADLAELPESLSLIEGLARMDLRGCDSLESLPLGFSALRLFSEPIPIDLVVGDDGFGVYVI